MKKQILKPVSVLLTVLLLLAAIPLSAMAASDAPAKMLNNIYLDALAYTGFKVQSQINDGTIFVKYARNIPSSVLSGIGYGTGPSGLETISANTKTGKAPDLAKFRSQGLCCASYVSYVYYNYLPNIAGVDTSSMPQPANPRLAASYHEAANGWVSSGKARRISFTQSGSTFTPAAEIPIGSLIVFKNPSDGRIAHVAIYAGAYNGKHFVTHVSDEQGPEIGTVEWLIKGNEAEAVVQIVVPQLLEANGKIQVLKKDPNGKNLAGAVFVATNSATGVQYPIGPTDQNGAAATKEGLPYGTYTVQETVFPTNYTASGQTSWTVTVSNTQQTVTVGAVNALKKGAVTVQKVDSETGKTVQGVFSFRIKSLSSGQTSAVYTTDHTGTVTLPEPLEYGKYELTEIQAPNGYLLNSGPVSFAVNGNITVKVTNQAQKGKIRLEKKGEMFASVKEENGVFIPVFEEKGLPGAKFNLLASDGTVADTLVTDESGKAESKALPLGTYTLREIEAPYGFLLDSTPKTVELSYAGQTVQTAIQTVSLTNTRQKASISLFKAMETDSHYGIRANEEIKNVSFGLFAEEELTALDGTTIPKDGLLEIATPNEEGKIAFTADLPIGAAVYVKEISTDEQYVPSELVFPLEVTYRPQGEPTVQITVNDGEPIENRLKRGRIEIRKTNENGEPLAGAIFGLFSPDDGEQTENSALQTLFSDENGLCVFEGIPYGHWTVKELYGVEGYVQNAEPHEVTVTEDGETVSVNIINKKIFGSVEIHKTDIANGRSLADAEFTVTDADGNEVQKGITDKDGVLRFEDLPYGKYILTETKAPKGYLAENRKVAFEIKEDGKRLSFHFTNKSETVPTSPKTGDNGKPFLTLAVLVLSLVTMMSAHKKTLKETKTK